MNERVSRLQSKLGEFADAALIFSEVSRFYFTGFPATDGCLFVTKDNAVFYTDSRYTEAAEKKIGEKFVRNSNRLYEELNTYFSDNGIKTVALENERLTLKQYEDLCKKLPGVDFVVNDRLSSTISSLRAVKTDDEIKEIVKAQRIAEKAFFHILGFIKPGLTEKQVRLELEYFMLSNGADDLSFETIAVAGVKTSMPHGVPGDNVIKDGDFVTMDYGALVNGYHSDMTRTVAVGHVSDEQKKVYDTVLKAHMATLSVLHNGISGVDADKAARDVITAAGYGDKFGHGTGHGVGVEIHEATYLSPKSKDTLVTGNVITDEPGIYIPGKFGVRIEDMALITDSGYELLTRCPKELIVL